LRGRGWVLIVALHQRDARLAANDELPRDAGRYLATDVVDDPALVAERDGADGHVLAWGIERVDGRLADRLGHPVHLHERGPEALVPLGQLRLRHAHRELHEPERVPPVRGPPRLSEDHADWRREEPADGRLVADHLLEVPARAEALHQDEARAGDQRG